MNPSIATATYPSQISKEIEVSLISFSNITGIPVTYFNNEAIINCEYNSGRKICKFLSSYHEENSVCKKKLISSIKIASTLGEPYIFTCSAGFVNIAISLIIKGEVVGC
ncbi:MAG: PocR ligand-binding domain-containing protein, partial [Anaerovorax sp.]